jgi:hypothetical protein
MQLTAARRAARTASVSVIAGFLLSACSGSSEPPPPVATVELTPADDTVDVGQATQLSAVLKDADGNILSDRVLAWTSGSPAVASVNQTGQVTGVADGEATITATSENRTGSASIVVIGPCSTERAAQITVGQTVNGSLSNADCRLTDEGVYGDGYGITVTTATSVQIDMTATFDTYLELLELLPSGDLVLHAENDDIDPFDPNNPNDPFDTNSRITFTLQPNLEYFILASSFDPNVFANYQLKVAAAAFVGGRTVGGKLGKAPISPRFRAFKPPK